MFVPRSLHMGGAQGARRAPATATADDHEDG